MKNRLLGAWPVLLCGAIWTWAIWSCAEHWRGNPNYSYGWAVPALALGFGVRRYLLNPQPLEPEGRPFRISLPLGLLAALALGGLAFFLEFSRQEMWHPQIILWSICLVAVGSTIALLRIRSGAALARAELFPVLFFLTAVPWPPRFEQPVTGALMRWVATVTSEVLHWLGVEAQTSGGAIALRSGLVGITEACSGVRSLQAGIMFGLAMGEWFLLRPARRIILLLVAIGLALTTNLIRTLALTLQAEHHGVDSLDRVHDLIGNVMMTTLILAIWGIGKVMAARRPESGAVARENPPHRVRSLVEKILGPASPVFLVLALTFLTGIVCARMTYGFLEAKDRTQTQAFFTARIDGEKVNHVSAVPKEVWDELRPTSGEYIRQENPQLPGGGADCFHFFWKPSPWNRFALVHRPDICMPGVGWVLDGPAETVDIAIDGRSVRCYLFRFRRGKTNALEVWGAWRNGEMVPLDYRPEQVLGAAPPPSSLHLEGKRRSATEIVACSIMADDLKPSAELAVALFQSVFNYKPNE